MSRTSFFLLVMLSAACTRPDASANELSTTTPRPVVVLPVEERPLAPAITAAGTIAGKEEVNLSFKISGVVRRVLVDPGARVAAGQVLAELSPDEIAAAAGRAREAHDKAQRDVARVRVLHNDSVATRVQLDDATTALRIAEQDLRAVEFNRSHAVIRAPAAGVILQRQIEPGQMAGPATPAISMRTHRRGLVMHVGLADRDVVRLRIGDRATIVLDAYPGRTFSARVATIPAWASQGSGTFNVELALESTEEPLASGLIGRAEISAQATGTYPVLPLDALIEADGDSAVVFVVPPGTDRVERRTIRIAHLAPGAVAVSSGIRAGESVVVRGGAWLNDGMLVSITPPRGGAR